MIKKSIISFKSILIVLLLGSMIFTGIELYKFVSNKNSVPQVKRTEVVSNAEFKQDTPKDTSFVQDATGDELTEQLKARGIDMGFINTTNIVRLKQQIPIKLSDSSKINNTNSPKHNTLDSILPIPNEGPQKNLLVWDEFKISAPLNYASFQDLYQANSDGIIDFEKIVNNDPTSSPIQQLLIAGIVHLPFSPLPGEQGNSYIIGHSSNYSSVKSDYNFVFAPLIEKTQNGQTFHIFDYAGRDLTFRVFESLAVKEEDVKEAYKNFGDRRVVTLQGSILETINGKVLPTKRWLVRAELVI